MNINWKKRMNIESSDNGFILSIIIDNKYHSEFKKYFYYNGLSYELSGNRHIHLSELSSMGLPYRRYELSHYIFKNNHYIKYNIKKFKSIYTKIYKSLLKDAKKKRNNRTYSNKTILNIVNKIFKLKKYRRKY